VFSFANAQPTIMTAELPQISAADGGKAAEKTAGPEKKPSVLSFRTGGIAEK
jgi:hypothetical protein